MGQYYEAFVLYKNWKVKNHLHAFDFDNGMKLMEHSYIGNEYTNAIYRAINAHPQRIAWIGDYSDQNYGESDPSCPYEKKISQEQFLDIYNMVWSNEDCFWSRTEIPKHLE